MKEIITMAMFGYINLISLAKVFVILFLYFLAPFLMDVKMKFL